MSAEYVRSQYGVNYKRGERLIVDGRVGTLVSFPEQYLGVRFDDNPKYVARCHPTWNVERAESKHGISVTIIRRDPNVWRGRCDCGPKWDGPTYEAVEDEWRKHVHARTGKVTKPWGDKEGRWTP